MQYGTNRRPELSALSGILILAVLYTLYFARIFLVPLVFALVLAIMMNPLVRWLKRIRVPVPLGAGIVVLMFLVCISAAIYNLSAPAAKWLDRGPYLLRHLEFKMSDFKSSLEKVRQASRKLEEMTDIGKQQTVQVQESSLAEKIFTRVRAFSSTAVIILVLLYFFMAYGPRMLHRLSASDSTSQNAYHLFGQVESELSGYLFTISLINAGLGVLTTLSMALLGLPNPILWGVIAALLNYIPYLGAAMTLLIISVVSLLTFDQPAQAIRPPLVFLVLTGLEGQLVTPAIVGRRLTINPLVVLVSILFWGWMWGIAGAILGVPILAAFMVAAKIFPSLHSIGRILK